MKQATEYVVKKAETNTPTPINVQNAGGDKQ
jgi:hypothetical protein